jgi:hypothetical protein
MRAVAVAVAISSALLAQEAQPPVETRVESRAETPAVTLTNIGAPLVVPFHCTEQDIQGAGLSCSEEEPCPVYLEVASIASSGLRIFAVGNIHTATATLYSVLLGTEDNGHTWREFYERIPVSGLDHIQFFGADTGWSSGLSLSPLPQDPFLLMTKDGGKTWRSHPIFDEPRFGTIQQFYFEDQHSGELTIDRGPGSGGDRYELYESNDGGETWNIRETNGKAIRLKRAPAVPNAEWRVRADAATKSFHLEHRLGEKWSTVAAFRVNLGNCKP